ncbi:glycosyltransferase [Nocardioides lacusdianchii]|uniref:glycosyltransferase n=1 Tax=Nocardioides lacusdianchii TaxID=2783664 RepID=UPI001CC95E13
MAVHRPDPQLLERQISSLAAQTESNWDCLIGIDGAGVETLQLLKRLIQDDTRMRVREYDDNVGVYKHFERLLAEVPGTASWVALADQDDVWHPTKLARITEVLSAPGVTAAMCQARVVDARGNLLGFTDRMSAGLGDLLFRNQVTGSLTVFSSKSVTCALPFPAGTSDAFHDYWLGVCAAALGEVRLCDERLQDYVQHATNVLGERDPRSFRAGIRAVLVCGVRGPLDRSAREGWGWRVNMETALCPTSWLERPGVVRRGRKAGPPPDACGFAVPRRRPATA